MKFAALNGYLVLVGFLLTLSATTVAETNPVVSPVWPIPQTFTTGTKSIRLGVNFGFECQAPGGDALSLLSAACARYTGTIRQTDGLLPEANPSPALGEIRSLRVKVDGPSTVLDERTDESYRLTIGDYGAATLSAPTVFGAIRGLETFAQLARRPKEGAGYIPGIPLNIEDKPSYAHRGLVLDTARSYLPVASILRQLDAMALSKLNVLHWHIVDAQSFPLVSEALPELSQKGAYAPDLVYTKQDVANIVKYARERGIRVIPEFDTPGHVHVWGLAYPNLTTCLDRQPDWDKFSAEPPSGQLNPTKPAALELVATLLKEQADWFPDHYVHLGGDEVNQNCYKSDPQIAAYMTANNLTPVQLIAGYIKQVHDTARKNQKVPLTWEEALLEYNVSMGNDAIVQVWQGSANVAKAVSRGFRTIVSPADYWYLDCGQGGWINTPQGINSWCDPFKTWQRIYTYDPLTNLAGLGQTDANHPLVIGGETALWTEKTDQYNLDVKAWPRAAAAAEVLWSGRRDKSGQERTTKDALPRIHILRRRLIRIGLTPDVINMRWCEAHPGHCEFLP